MSENLGSPHLSDEALKPSEIMEAEALSKLLETPEAKELKKSFNESVMNLRVPAVPELVRFLESDKYSKLQDGHIESVSEYHGIEIEGEAFFAKPFTSGKEPAVILTLSREGNLGRAFVLEKIRDSQRFLEEEGKLPVK